MQSFNLVTDPWIKVLDSDTNSEKLVSLKELFRNAGSYRQLAGEMHAQDLAILRLLEAILITVYSRVDADNQIYDWVVLNKTMQVQTYENPAGLKLVKTLSKTWKKLYESGNFTDAIFEYLDKNITFFDFFGQRPFYQVTAEQYDSFVEDKKKIKKGSGTVDLMQMNRLISQSGNSIAIFAPKSSTWKNKLSLDELIRWLITYQNFTGVTDKTKVRAKEKHSNSRGWLYTLNPIFVKGNNLFQTLMLNLVLFNPSMPEYVPQQPVWEENLIEYVKKRLSRIKPDNIAETYTVWSRLLHIEWKEEGPVVFSAGLPAFESTNTFDIEPMSIWRKNRKDGNFYPATKGLSNMGIAMWRNFGQYVPTLGNNEAKKSLAVEWLNFLKKKTDFSGNKMINLHTSGIISNGGATSLMPAAEFDDNLRIESDVLFDCSEDKANMWPARIEEMVELNQEVGRKYYRFLMEVGQIRFGQQGAGDFAARQSQAFYDSLNEPFTEWISGLTGNDNRETKQNAWKKELRQLALKILDDFLDIIAPRDISGEKDNNIFIAANRYRCGLNKVLRNG
ncbi:type I-E CRISPR-associated protein Cse1/CasA [Allisonella histaminiformans]|uniref:type I-E CRISPR-associated protein Cse1/CasA n=1 Tax=Allisonella histaminiformans TaxID=209880 RepID=UPI003F8C347B